MAACYAKAQNAVDRPFVLRLPGAIVPAPAAFLPPVPALGQPITLKLARKPEAKAKDRKAVIEDVLWALLNSKEFMCNH